MAMLKEKEKYVIGLMDLNGRISNMIRTEVDEIFHGRGMTSESMRDMLNQIVDETFADCSFVPEESNKSASGTQGLWVPLRKAEPDADGEYIVTFDDGFVATVTYADGDWELWADCGEPIAWMDLPKPYRR